MPYTTEADYRATIVAYRALHDLFYRFHHSVSAQQADPSAADGHNGLAAIAVDEQDFGGWSAICCRRSPARTPDRRSISTGSWKRSASWAPCTRPRGRRRSILT